LTLVEKYKDADLVDRSGINGTWYTRKDRNDKILTVDVSEILSLPG